MQRDEPVWAIATFDLPTGTAEQRREAARHRKYLLSLGFSRVQLSVYTRYVINGSGFSWLARQVGAAVPPEGVVRVIPVSDREWGRSLCFEGKNLGSPEAPPEQLALF